MPNPRSCPRATSTLSTAVLHRFFNWLVERGYADENPLVHIEPPSLDEKTVPVVTETRTSDGTEPVASQTPPNTPAEGAPAITGTARVGETLTVDTSGIQDAEGMGNATFTYRWISGGTDIPGATGASHSLTEDDEGLAIQVWVSFTDNAGMMRR